MSEQIEYSLETLDNILVELIKIENIKHKILNQINVIKTKIKENEIIELKIVKDGKNFKVIFNIVNTSLPKCFIINNEYKFNFYTIDTLSFSESEYK